MQIWAHFKTINRHRWLVCKYCFRLGLYWQGLTHDLSKYSPQEFWIGARYFQGDRSPNDAERRDRGYSSAWLHHKGRNRHHLEYWTDYGSHGEGIVGVEMPVKYVAEMFCDRLAASRVYRGGRFDNADPWKFFQRSKAHAILNPNTSALLESMVVKLRDEGENAAFDYIRCQVLGKRRRGARPPAEAPAALTRDDLLRELRAAPLDLARCWLTAGGALVLRGLRDTTADIDIGCLSSMADELERAGYPTEHRPDGSRAIHLPPHTDVFENFGGGFTENIDGIPTVGLADLLRLKRELGREKDQADIAALETALGKR